MGRNKSKFSNLKEKIDSYFNECDMFNNEKEIVKPYTISGLMSYLGISRKEFEMLSQMRKYAPVINVAKSKIEAFIEEKALTGKLSVNASQGSLKYNFGWGEKTDIKKEDTPGEIVVTLEGDGADLAR